MPNDQRLIEDYIPIEAISAEARREKSIRKGHISTLHLWWARRPLVAARAAVYGALVPAPIDKKDRQGVDEFVTALCKYPGNPETIRKAQGHILQAHAERLSAERGELVTVADIEAGRAPRPRVLDMFAGGGAIPLEALRLGCEAYALDLNPVAHLIELCTLVYPQQFGQPDPASRGSAVDGTWAGLAAEVEYWGQWVLEQVRAEIGDLYPPIPDPQAAKAQTQAQQLTMNLAISEPKGQYGPGMLTPVTYLWTRTVPCKNPACGATVPLARQTWLAKKAGRYVALQPVLPDNGEKRVQYKVVGAKTPEGLGFDPEAGSKAGNVSCPFCGTVADSDYVMAIGKAKKRGVQPIAVVCTRPGAQGKVYLSVAEMPFAVPDETLIWQKIQQLEIATKDDPLGILNIPDEVIREDRPSPNARGLSAVTRHGFIQFSDLFTARQLLSLLTFAKNVRRAFVEMQKLGYQPEASQAVIAYLGILVDRQADYNSSFCSWTNTAEKIGHTFARQALPMVWDFVELNPFGDASGNASAALDWITGFIEANNSLGLAANAQRGSATQMGFAENTFDAIITDPPYYDNVPYSDLSDYFYVWLKRSIGFAFPEHFSSPLAPKKQEAIMDTGRHQNDAKDFYEQMMSRAFSEAGRTLKADAPLIVVYAHKTTLGWATLVDALRNSGFTVTEAWPLDTEREARMLAQETAALASSIFLVTRRREDNATANYERDVRPDLHAIVRERLERLWAQGVTGADLVIACVGAGLRAFTKYAKVEYANGEPVPADTFLAEVEGAVLEALLEKLFGVNSAGIRGIDPVTRFYVLWRFAYRFSALDAGEAIVFAYPQHVELEGPRALTAGTNPLVVRNKGQYLLRDFSERGLDESLGLPNGEGLSAPLIDVLHRLLWLVENRPALIPAYLDESKPDLERLRVVSQTLAGQTLSGGEAGKAIAGSKGAEAAALRKLTTNWRALIESHRGALER